MLVLNPAKRKSAAELCNHAYFEGWKPSISTNCSTAMVKFSLDKAKSTEPYRIDPNTGKAIVHISSKSTWREDKLVIQKLQEQGLEVECSVTKNLEAKTVAKKNAGEEEWRDVTMDVKRKRTNKERQLIVDGTEKFVTEIKKRRYRCIKAREECECQAVIEYRSGKFF